MLLWCQWERVLKHENLVLWIQLIKVELPPWKICKADFSSVSPSSIRSDEELTLEMSAFQIFHRGNSTFIDPFDRTKFAY